MEIGYPIVLGYSEICMAVRDRLKILTIFDYDRSL
jgi:hypothetical protein